MKVLLVHNRYRSAQPSGENAVVEEERSLLDERGVETHLLTVESDSIAGWSPWRKATVPGRVIWSRGRPQGCSRQDRRPASGCRALSQHLPPAQSQRPVGRVGVRCEGREDAPQLPADLSLRHALSRRPRLRGVRGAGTPPLPCAMPVTEIRERRRYRWRSPMRCTAGPGRGSAASMRTSRRRRSPAAGTSPPAGHPSSWSSSTTPFVTSPCAGTCQGEASSALHGWDRRRA